MRIGARCRETRGRIFLNLPACFLQRGDQPASGLGALTVLVMLAKFPKLPCRPRRKSDQRRRVFLLAFLAAALASSRARLSRRSRMTTSPGTIRPAARSASLSARTSSHPAGAIGGVGVSSITAIIDGPRPPFQSWRCPRPPLNQLSLKVHDPQGPEPQRDHVAWLCHSVSAGVFLPSKASAPNVSEDSVQAFGNGAKPIQRDNPDHDDCPKPGPFSGHDSPRAGFAHCPGS